MFPPAWREGLGGLGGGLIENLNITMFAGGTTEQGVIFFVEGHPPTLFGNLFFKIFLAFITKPSVAFRRDP
jgi:hypothetical protein